MNSAELRQKFLDFFEKRGHKIVPSSSLLPTDPSVLFTTAGMQQFKPYYTAPQDAVRDFGTKNVTTVQKCVRTNDIDEVGDNTHLTFFEMLGNFSFGGYGRKEAITYAHEFITKELGLAISYVSIYKGLGVVPRDEESATIWRELDPKLEIKEEGADVFWGPTGENGPCGPTTEIYCKNAEGKNVEIWNIVFNEYFCDGSREKLDKGEATLEKLPVLGIDTGMGLERLLTIVENKGSVYDTDAFHNEQTREERIVADHIKAALFMISDDIKPGKDERGYVPRRLLRLAETVRYLFIDKGNLESESFYKNKINIIIEKYKDAYGVLQDRKEFIIIEILKEIANFQEILKEMTPDKLEKLYVKFYLEKFKKSNISNEINGEILFKIRETFGVGWEILKMLFQRLNYEITATTEEEYNVAYRNNQNLSRTASAGMFKGGLADHEPATIKLHTAHHLLLAALQELFGKQVKQRGSNITSERLRIDFSFDRKITDEEKKKLEDMVNEKIATGLDVVKKEMPLEEAQKIGAEMEFGVKYGNTVSVYFIEDKNGNVVSKEFCGGPHVGNTSELGKFKIIKEEASSQGVRRIKAILQ